MLDAIAITVLAVMMLIPGVNLLVGIVAGGASFGVSGAFATERMAYQGIMSKMLWLSRAYPFG